MSEYTAVIPAATARAVKCIPFISCQCFYIGIHEIGHVRSFVSGESGYGRGDQQQRGTREKKFFLHD